MTQVCDFASPVNLQAVKDAGFVGIIRYVSDYAWKNITPTEYANAKHLGLTVTLVCEQGNQPAMRGTLGGMHDSTIAEEQANALGYDPHATIYYVAEDPNVLPQADWPTVEEYFKGLAWAKKRPVGAYGSGPLCAHLKSLGLVQKTWTVSTWGSPVGDSLEQMVGGDTHGLSVDADNVIQPNYGQDPQPASAPVPTPTPTPPPTTTGAYVQTPITFSVSGGHGWAASPVAAARVVNVIVDDENPDVVKRYDNVPIFVARATQPGPDSPNGALVFAGGADGTYGATVISE